MISTLVTQCRKWCYDLYRPLGGTNLITHEEQKETKLYIINKGPDTGKTRVNIRIACLVIHPLCSGK